MKRKQKNIKILISSITISLLLIWGNYTYVSYFSKKFIFNDSNTIPKYKYGLLLGTPKYLSNGNINNYYKNRITSTVELYAKRKIDRIIISADTLNKYKENEVQLMQFDLIEKGISKSDLILDTNGNSTWKSITNL